MKLFKKIVLVSILSIAFLSCDKNNDSIIPDAPVNFYIDLNIVNDLIIPGNSVFFNGHGYYGYGGVIVYCESQGNYLAYDATCTHEINSSCIVENDGLSAKCKCCDSEYVLIGGNVINGPAAAPLKQYRVSLQQNRIWVYN